LSQEHVMTQKILYPVGFNPTHMGLFVKKVALPLFVTVGSLPPAFEHIALASAEETGFGRTEYVEPVFITSVPASRYFTS
jgi:hypothetical protein